MNGIHVDNVNEALPIGLGLVRDRGVEVVSRGIATIEVPGPVATTYVTPQRRVLFDEVRDANPFFHLFESLWVLSGCDNVALPAFFLPSITRFSDNGVTFHGAYGRRLRNWYGVDQLKRVVRLLSNRPDTRQAVISIWDPALDLGASTKDMPCNDMVMFSIRNDALNMTVCNRSNDVIWGAYGANAVQFSVLQEWVAVAVGANVGTYTQVSNSYHVYPDNPFWGAFLRNEHDSGHVANPYMFDVRDLYPLAITPEEAHQMLADCEDMSCAARMGLALSSPPEMRYSSPFFNRVVIPALKGLELYREGDHHGAMEKLRYVEAPDWRYAMIAWVLRRLERKQAAGSKA